MAALSTAQDGVKFFESLKRFVDEYKKQKVYDVVGTRGNFNGSIDTVGENF